MGAAARQMLLQAAARDWGCVPRLPHRAGVVVHVVSGRRASYGSLALKCADIAAPDPKAVSLKDQKNSASSAKPLAQYHTPQIVTGAPLFGIDVVRPGMLYATFAEGTGVRRQVGPGQPRQRAPCGVRKVFVVEGADLPSLPDAMKMSGLLPAWRSSRAAGGRRGRPRCVAARVGRPPTASQSS